MAEHLGRRYAGIKPAVLARAARRIGDGLLANWLTCWDPVHLGVTRSVVALERHLRRPFGAVVDEACAQLFHGHVVPVQRALVLIGEARGAALGRCVCRAAGVTQDLEQGGTTYLVCDEPTAARHLDALLSATRGARADDREATDERLLAILDEMASTTGSAKERIALLWRRSYPYWEILLEHPSMTDTWRENMARHDKSWRVQRSLLSALAAAQYHTRGAVFTRMEAVDQTYALCTCPGPENDGGCSLVNWYYAARLDGALYPNRDDFHGQARDEHGRPLPCQRHEARRSRPCLGCGCEHERS